jgi:hypothetical protein
MAVAIWITVAIVCFGLCVYGIATAIRRAEERGRQDALSSR